VRGPDPGADCELRADVLSCWR